LEANTLPKDPDSEGKMKSTLKRELNSDYEFQIMVQRGTGFFIDLSFLISLLGTLPD
jgi:hypothetical protein